MMALTIDGTTIQARPGTTILAAADAAGIYIPRLCSHPDLPATDTRQIEPWDSVFQGSALERYAATTDRSAQRGPAGCMLCLVEVDGAPEPVKACATEIADGMNVVTKRADLDRRRSESLRAIFATHPHACVICGQRAGCALEPCSTNVAKAERCCPIFHSCELRAVAEYVGIPADTPRYQPSDLPIVADEPLFLRDYNLCIGCLRCVRVCRDVRGIDALGFVLDENDRAIVGTRGPTLEASGCIFCLSCVEVCPTGSLRLKFADPRLDGERVTCCVAHCPAGMDIPRYLREIRRGEYARAAAVIREAAPLPRVLGQVCYHPCEDHCLRRDLSDAIAICGLKRTAVEHDDTETWRQHLSVRPDTGKRVAIVGAGPTGLTAAWYLGLKGHRVYLLDAQPEAGGWLRDGIPRYRLSRAALDADIADIMAIGVHPRLGVAVGSDVSFEQIKADHDAVLIAAGTRGAKGLTCEGAGLPGVEMGLELLGRAAVSATSADGLSGETVVVIGGGNVALDVARTALRLGAGQVHVYCLERREQMPAHAWEADEAEREGVILHPGWGPVRMLGADRVERVEFHECTRVFDDAGSFKPEFDDATTASQEADRVFIAIGQQPDLSFIESRDRSNVAAHQATTQPGVFAAGDVLTGPASVVAAVAEGKRAAAEIDRYLGGDGEIHVRLVDPTEPESAVAQDQEFAKRERIAQPHLATADAVRSFAPVELGYGPDDATREAARCLRCDLRLAIRKQPLPPDPLRELNEGTVAEVPAVPGVYQLLDDEKTVYAIKGVTDLRAGLSEVIATTTRGRYFLYEPDPMYTKRESELIQEFLKQHGCMPPGEGEDDLDDLF